MQEELKTLKEIESLKEGDTIRVLEGKTNLIYKNDLKQEAIKWLKSDKCSGMTKEWIMGFFNIKEEDINE